jgi:hypothetical protein
MLRERPKQASYLQRHQGALGTGIEKSNGNGSSNPTRIRKPGNEEKIKAKGVGKSLSPGLQAKNGSKPTGADNGGKMIQYMSLEDIPDGEPQSPHDFRIGQQISNIAHGTDVGGHNFQENENGDDTNGIDDDDDDDGDYEFGRYIVGGGSPEKGSFHPPPLPYEETFLKHTKLSGTPEQDPNSPRRSMKLAQKISTDSSNPSRRHSGSGSGGHYPQLKLNSFHSEPPALIYPKSPSYRNSRDRTAAENSESEVNDNDNDRGDGRFAGSSSSSSSNHKRTSAPSFTKGTDTNENRGHRNVSGDASSPKYPVAALVSKSKSRNIKADHYHNRAGAGDAGVGGGQKRSGAVEPPLPLPLLPTEAHRSRSAHSSEKSEETETEMTEKERLYFSRQPRQVDYK